MDCSADPKSRLPYCSRCNSLNHLEQDCDNTSRFKCTKCHGLGHVAAKCNNPNVSMCDKCHMYGHLSNKCKNSSPEKFKRVQDWLNQQVAAAAMCSSFYTGGAEAQKMRQMADTYRRDAQAAGRIISREEKWQIESAICQKAAEEIFGFAQTNGGNSNSGFIPKSGTVNQPRGQVNNATTTPSITNPSPSNCKLTRDQVDYLVKGGLSLDWISKLEKQAQDDLQKGITDVDLAIIKKIDVSSRFYRKECITSLLQNQGNWIMEQQLLTYAR